METRSRHHEAQGAGKFTELRAKNNAGEEVSFDVFSEKVVLVVNVARL